MLNKISIKEQVFNDFKENIDHLSKVDSIDELLQNEESFHQLQSLFTTLKVIQPLKEVEMTESTMIEEGERSEEIESDIHQDYTEDLDVELVEEEKLSLSEENFKNDDDKILEENNEFSIEPEDNLETISDSVEESVEKFETQQEEIIQEEEEDIVEEVDEEPIQEISDSEEFTKAETSKVKLSTIKGVKTNALFDEEELEEMKQEPIIIQEKIQEEPKKQDFKLDLNDKIAFTKILFDGRQTELNETIQVLNSFDKVEQAQEYLSDMYYKKNWDKVEEYAQRLWSLVENKFY